MPFLSCCPSPETTVVAVMLYAPHSCVARCMMPRRWRAHLSPVSCSLASTVQTFPATSSICSAMLDMSVVCSQSRSYTFSVCKIVVCVCVCCACACVRMRVCVRLCVCTCGGQRRTLCISYSITHSLSIPPRQGLSLTLQLGWQPAGPSNAVSTSPLAAVPDFLCGCWGLNSSPRDCKASAPLTEPPSQSLFDTFSKVLFWLFVFYMLQRRDM